MRELPVAKLVSVERRYHEIEHLLCTQAVLTDPPRMQKLNKELSDLEPVVNAFSALRDVEKRLADDRVALADPELAELAEMEIPELESERERLAANLELLLLPKDPNDERNTIVELRSGEGGEDRDLRCRLGARGESRG